MAERLLLYPTADFKSLVVWGMERQSTLGQLEGHDDEVSMVAARGSLAVSCQDSGPVRARVWNLETMQCTATLPEGEAGDATIYSACCMEGRVLLGQEDGIIKVWDISASTPVALADLKGHTSPVCGLKATAAGSMVLSGSHDTTVRLWDLRTGSGCVRAMKHSQRVQSVDMDGHCRTAVSGSKDGSVRLWDLGSGRCSEMYQGHADEVRDVVMHESGNSFLTSSMTDGMVTAWAVGSTRAIMRADMASYCVPRTRFIRLFSSRNLSTIALCSISDSQMGFSFWS